MISTSRLFSVVCRHPPAHRAQFVAAPVRKVSSSPTAHSDFGITDAMRKSYRSDGVICVRNAFSLDWIKHLGAATDAAVARDAENKDMEEYSANEDGSGRFCAEMDCTRKYADFQHFIFESSAAQLAAEVMGSSRVAFFYDILFVKEPGTKQRTVWHQDQAYWQVGGNDVCSIWLPLDPVPRASCLEFVRGSHINGIEYAPFRFADGAVYDGAESMPKVPDMEAARHSFDILNWDMELGDCLVFDYRTLHSAPGVADNAPRRRAHSTRWGGDDAHFTKETKCRQTQSHGYPPFNCGLQEGEPLSHSQAFPLMWPADAAERPSYKGLDAEKKAAVLQLQPSAEEYAAIRSQFAGVYTGTSE